MALTLNETIVHQMYIAYYQRAADPDGLAYWLAQIEKAGGWPNVAAAFGAPENAEYQGLYGGKTRAEIVTELYQSSFNRPAVQDEIDFWVASSFADTLMGFAIINGAQNADLAAVTKKVDFSVELGTYVVSNAGYAQIADPKALLKAIDANSDVSASAVADLVGDKDEITLETSFAADALAFTDAQNVVEVLDNEMGVGINALVYNNNDLTTEAAHDVLTAAAVAAGALSDAVKVLIDAAFAGALGGDDASNLAAAKVASAAVYDPLIGAADDALDAAADALFVLTDKPAILTAVLTSKITAEGSARADAALTNAADAGPASLGATLLDGANDFTAGDDLYRYNEFESDGVSLTGFGVSGEDQIFFGEGFSLVQIADGKDINDSVGDSGVLEILWQQQDNDLVLYVEKKAFAGNNSADATTDITIITLTGFDAGGITSFADGFLSAGEVA